MPERAIRRCRALLGTFVEITAPRGHEAAVYAAFAAVAHVHARMSFHEEGSDLAAMRRAPAGTTVSVDAATVDVLRTAAHLHERSAGLFDVTIGTRLVADGFLPAPPDVMLATMTGTAGDIELVDETHVCCRFPVLIDLGGIAKGFAVDRAVAALQAAGVDRAVVNAGGDLRVFGDRAERVHLRAADGSLGAAIDVVDAAVATSANLAGRRIVDGAVTTPHRGRDRSPVVAGNAVSIVALRCVVADAMTKVALADPVLAARMLVELDGEIVTIPALRAA